MVNAALPAPNLELPSNRHEEGGDVNDGICGPSGGEMSCFWTNRPGLSCMPETKHRRRVMGDSPANRRTPSHFPIASRVRLRYRTSMKRGLKNVRRPTEDFRRLQFAATPSVAGFSLIELLAVAAILLLLFTLYWGSSASDNQSAATSTQPHSVWRERFTPWRSR